MMKLSLIIPVYNGGDYWRECWESVKDNLNFFEGVYISFNYSPKQIEDIALVRDFSSDKIHWIKHDKMMSAVEHSLKIDRWIGSLHLPGHVMILCHDDILLREGLKELSKMELQDDDAVFGSFHFFSQTGRTREMTLCELYRKDGKPLSQELSFTLFSKHVIRTISGNVLPLSVMNEGYNAWLFLRHGCWAEDCHLNHPHIKRIFQTATPTVKIRWHDTSENAKVNTKDQEYDTLVQLSNLFVVIRDSVQKKEIVRALGGMIRQKPLRRLWYFMLIQYKFRKLNYYYPEGLKIYLIVGKMIVEKWLKAFNPLCRKE